MKKYDVIAFDLDGTLTDPSAGQISGYKYALGKMGVDYGSDEQLRRYIGPPIYEEWQKGYGLTPEEAGEAVRLFREYFSVYGWWDNKVYPGIPELLARLKESGKKIILATSKPDVFALKILELFDLKKYFDFFGTATFQHIREKKWEVLDYALKGIGSPDFEKCVMVGDRKYDAEGAQICGIDSIGVLHGHGSREELEEAGFTYICEDAYALAKLLI